MSIFSKKGTSLIVSFMMFFGILCSSFTNVFAEGNTNEQLPNYLKKVDNSKIIKALTENMKEASNTMELENYGDKYSDEETVRVMVELNSVSLSEIYNVNGLAQAENNETMEFQNAIITNQNTVINSIQNSIGNPLNVKRQFSTLVNAFSAEMSYEAYKNLGKASNIKSAYIMEPVYLDMNHAAKMTADPAKIYQELGYKGEGMVISIIDTGIDYQHKDMRLSTTTSMALTQEKVLSLRLNNEKLKKGSYFTNKVPFGYNYADENRDVIPAVGTSSHGMHVGGIVAANGIDEDVAANNGVKGVAPEAQLLAMKVFSNRPEGSGAWPDDQVAAIEDSVLLGADVINMSLGGTAGFQSADNITQKAIKEASMQGVVVIVSAGNSEYSSYPWTYDEYKDTGLNGTPGIGEYAITVASYENDMLTSSTIKFDIDGKELRALYNAVYKDPVEELSGEYQLVYCGRGGVKDFEGKNLDGKVALIERGDRSFQEKIDNAAAAGAIAVIVFNNDGGGESLLNMSIETVDIPALFVKQSVGQAMLTKVDKTKVAFDGGLVTSNNPAAGRMSDFTSWGPAHTLDFKPMISGVGGNVLSTIARNGYENMSGTSMAAPYVAGATALMLQDLKVRGVELENEKKWKYVKSHLINTSIPVMDKVHNNYYSPRRQGAGLVSVNNAVNNSVTVEHNNNPLIVLKEVGKVIEMPLTITNHGDKTVKFEIDASPVLTREGRNIQQNGFEYDIPLKGAKIEFDKTELTVTTGSSLVVNAKITLTDETPKGNYVEGFIRFNSLNDNNSDVGTSYMGFYGEWDSMDNLDKPIWDKNNFFKKTTVKGIKVEDNVAKGFYFLGADNYYNDNGDKKALSINPENIAVNPFNKDGHQYAIPQVTVLRNIESIKIDVVDEAGNLVTNLDEQNYIRKIRDMLDPAKRGVQEYRSFDWVWRGTKFDSESGKNVAVADGQYYFKITSKLAFEGAKEQVMKLPIKVDTTAPVIGLKGGAFETYNSDKYKLEFDVKDITDTNKYAIILTDLTKEEEEKGYKKVLMSVIPEEGLNFPDVLKLDEAQVPKLSDIYNKDTGKYELDIDLTNMKDVQIEVVTYDAALNVGKAAKKLVRENNVYNISIKNPTMGQSFTDEDKVVVEYELNENLKRDITKLTAMVIVEDENGDLVPVKKVESKDLTKNSIYIGKLSGGMKYILLNAETADGHSVKAYTVVKVAYTEAKLVFDELEDGMNIDAKNNPFTITGEVRGAFKEVLINGVAIRNTEGKFAHTIELVQGNQTINVKLTNLDDSVYEYGYAVFVDSIAPEIKFDNINTNYISGDVINVPVDDDMETFILSGSVSDKNEVKFYYNGNFEGNISELPHNFKYEVKLTDKTTQVFVKAEDAVGNSTIKTINFIKGEMPKVEITNLTNKETFTKGEQANIKIEASNKMPDLKSASVIVAIYTNEGLLVSLNSVSKTLLSGETVIIDTIVTIPTEGNYVVKAFVWDGLETMNPLSDVYTFEVK